MNPTSLLEVLKYLEDNLKIEMRITDEWDDHKRITTEIHLGGNLISMDSIEFRN